MRTRIKDGTGAEGRREPPGKKSFFMPIVNGTYVPESLGTAKQAQNTVFGEYSRRDMSDYSTAAYNYLMKQQEQAYNLELWKLNNEYNSPAAQMQRYQDAGLNPNLIYSQSNMASAPSSSQAASFRSSGTMSKGIQNGLNAVSRVMETVKAARDTYDYWMYGAAGHRLQNNADFYRGALLRSQGDAAQLNSLWLNYLMGSPDAPDYSGTPRGRMYQFQADAQEAKVNQIRQLISASLSGQERTDALKELDQYRLKILSGQNDAILNIHTGLGDSFDGFLKAMIYLAMSKI